MSLIPCFVFAVYANDTVVTTRLPAENNTKITMQTQQVLVHIQFYLPAPLLNAV
jgi:hypothetical protein